jgi:hypothetical protein
MVIHIHSHQQDDDPYDQNLIERCTNSTNTPSNGRMGANEGSLEDGAGKGAALSRRRSRDTINVALSIRALPLSHCNEPSDADHTRAIPPLFDTVNNAIQTVIPPVRDLQMLTSSSILLERVCND